MRSIDDLLFKTCARCHELKPISEFVFINKSKGERQPWCRPCDAAYKREWYAKNRKRHLVNARRSNQRTRNENRARVLSYLSTHPCVDCGESDPIVLEFDHIRDKVANVSKMVMECWRWETIAAEIAKCDVRCANCHRRKTARELKWHERYERPILESPVLYAY